MRRTILLLLAALCALVLIGPAQAAPRAKKAEPPPVKVTGARVLEFGTYTSTVEHREKSPAVADGIKDRATDFRLVRKSTLVAASLGTGIGLSYMLLGTPKGASVTLEVSVSHPAMLNLETRETMTRSSASYERVLGEPAHAVWSFDTQAGLVPGEYVIELMYEGRVLAKKEFRVTVRR